MNRVAFKVVWTFVLTFVFLILFCVVAGVVSAVIKQTDASIDETSRQWAMPIFFGCMLAAVAVSTCGLLPGTRRPPAVATGPDAAADYDLPPDRDFPADRDVRPDCDYPPARPTIAVPLGTLDDPPPQLAALGRSLSVHAPGFVAAMSGSSRLVTLVLGLVLFFAPAFVIDAVGHDHLPPSARKVLVYGGLLAGLMCLVIAVVPRSPHTYRVHRDALVVSDRKIMHIVPWDQIQALIPEMPFFKDLTVVTRDGQELPITSVRGYHQLKDTVFVRVRDHLLPLMIKRANAGRMVEFGPLGVSSDALRYKSQTTSWDDVTRLLILTGSGINQLMVYRRSGLGLWAFCRLNLDRVPNNLLLIELLKQIAPPRLLVPAEARW